MTQNTIILASLLASALPIVFWFVILNHKNHKGYLGRFWFVFVLSGIGAMFMFEFTNFFEDQFVSWGMGLFMIYFIFGAVIEYFKNLIVRMGGWRYCKSIDDVMDLSFAAALGYVAFENFFHFYLMFNGGIAGVSGDIIEMIKYFLVREFFILPIHLFCSGIFGYFYALGIFAKGELRENQEKKLIHRMLTKLIFWTRDSTQLYKTVRIMQGTLISVGSYALLYTILKIDPTVFDVFRMIGLVNSEASFVIDERLWPIITFGFFKIGTLLLFTLMDHKRRLNKQGFLHGHS